MCKNIAAVYNSVLLNPTNWRHYSKTHVPIYNLWFVVVEKIRMTPLVHCCYCVYLYVDVLRAIYVLFATNSNNSSSSKIKKTIYNYHVSNCGIIKITKWELQIGPAGYEICYLRNFPKYFQFNVNILQKNSIWKWLFQKFSRRPIF